MFFVSVLTIAILGVQAMGLMEEIRHPVQFSCVLSFPGHVAKGCPMLLVKKPPRSEAQGSHYLLRYIHEGESSLTLQPYSSAAGHAPTYKRVLLDPVHSRTFQPCPLCTFQA